MSWELYVTYFAASFLVVVIPGPSVTLIVANSLRHGTGAGLAIVGGTQLGIAAMIVALALGLTSLIELMGEWFDWLRLAGAAYLAWLGWKMLRERGDLGEAAAQPRPRRGFFLQGFLVALSNPKMLLFFGAFIPQFIDPAGNTVAQVLLLGGTSIATAAVCDSGYAILSGRAGGWLSRQRVRLLSRIGGVCLIGGAVWLAFTRRA
jgi:threonine/homoserine/homoserine lactone efflux protein